MKQTNTQTTGNIIKKVAGLPGNSTQSANNGIANESVNNKISMIQDRLKNAVQLSFEKAVAHHENPSMYPLSTDNKTIERAFYNLIESLPHLKRNRIIDKINETFKAAAPQRNTMYKDLVNVNFKSAVSVAEQVKCFSLPDEMKFTKPEINEIEARVSGIKSKRVAVTRQAVSASKLSFFVDNMTCLNPDDIRKDEISLAGFAVDNLGNSVDFNPFFVGKFRKNETVLLGNKSKLFSIDLSQINQFPVSFTAGLFIIEKDLVSNQDAVNKLSTLFTVISIAVAILVLSLVAAAVLVGLEITVLTLDILSFVGTSFLVLGVQIIPLIGDDISFAVNDVLTVADKINVGETVERTIQIGKGFDSFSTFDGKYTASARWVGEA